MTTTNEPKALPVTDSDQSENPLTSEQIAAHAKICAEAPNKDWTWDGRKVDGEGYVYIPECSYLGDTTINMASNSYDGYAKDCDYVALACAELPRYIRAISSSNTRAEVAEAEVLRLKGLVNSAYDLLRIARTACSKMGLRGRGSDIGMSHEARMFALNFSPEERTGPGALQVNGNGACVNWMRSTINPPTPAKGGA